MMDVVGTALRAVRMKDASERRPYRKAIRHETLADKTARGLYHKEAQFN